LVALVPDRLTLPLSPVRQTCEQSIEIAAWACNQLEAGSFEEMNIDDVSRATAWLSTSNATPVRLPLV
jgi:hypothetical protein